MLKVFGIGDMLERKLKGPVIAAIFALGVVVGCSQKDGTTATAVPAPAVARAADPAVAIEPDLPVATVRGLSGAPSGGRGFVPLDNPSFLDAHEAGYLADEELVLGVEWAGEFRAYPVRMLRFHHIVNDTVDGEPLLVTY